MFVKSLATQDKKILPHEAYFIKITSIVILMLVIDDVGYGRGLGIFCLGTPGSTSTSTRDGMRFLIESSPTLPLIGGVKEDLRKKSAS